MRPTFHGKGSRSVLLAAQVAWHAPSSKVGPWCQKLEQKNTRTSKGTSSLTFHAERRSRSSLPTPRRGKPLRALPSDSNTTTPNQPCSLTPRLLSFRSTNKQINPPVDRTPGSIDNSCCHMFQKPGLRRTFPPQTTSTTNTTRTPPSPEVSSLASHK